MNTRVLDHPLRKSMCALLLAVGVFAAMVPFSSSALAQGEQWYLSSMDVPAAHESTKGDGVTVAVVDTGVGPHPDVDSNLLEGHYPGGTDESDTSDIDGHGTAMSGLIAGTGDGESTVMGIAPEAEILPVKVQEGGGEVRGGNMYIPVGIKWAVDAGADVINVSMAQDGEKDDLAEAIEYAQSKDVVVVSGAGNVYGGPVQWPAAYPGVVAVSATGPDGQLWQDDDAGSSFGEEVAIAAPGAELRCLEPDATGSGAAYDDDCRGTSPATAIVSGAAALVRAANPDMDAANVVNRLIATAQQSDGSQERTPEFGYGIVDPVAALTADMDDVDANPLGALAEDDTEAASDEVESGSGFTPMIIAAVAGGAILLALIVVGIVVAVRGKKKRKGLNPDVMPQPPYTGGQAQWSGVPGQSAPPPGSTPDNQAGGPQAPPRNVQPPQ